MDDATGLLGRQAVQLGAVVLRHGLSSVALADPLWMCGCFGESRQCGELRGLGEVVMGGLRSLVPAIEIKAELQLIVWQLHVVCGSKVVGNSQAGDWQLQKIRRLGRH